MKRKTIPLVAAGTLLAIAFAVASPSIQPLEVKTQALPTPYSADHARISTPIDDAPPTF